MRYLKSFESYSVEEIEGGKVFEEKCADCNCNCDDCDCPDCECPKCCGKTNEGVNALSKEEAEKYLDGSKFRLDAGSSKGCYVITDLSTKQKAGYLWYPDSSYGKWAAHQKGEGAYAIEESIHFSLNNLSEKKKATMKAEPKKKEEKPEVKGLSAKQKKLPPAMQAAILKKMGKSAPKKADDKDDKKEKRIGLTAGQRKLPEAMQKAILAKQKK
jgi:hypothetical protein